MANHVSHGSLPYPIKNARFTLLVPYLDADGDPTDPTTPDTELSGDAGAFADCAEEVSTITGSNGMGYLTLSGAETNYSLVALAAKVASGPKATLATLYPRNLPTLSSGTLSAGSAGGGTLGTVLAYDLTGCFIRTTGGTGGGGTGGANNQARRIATYTVSTGAFTVTPNWETTPDNTTTYDVLLPEGVTVGMLKTLNPTTAGRTLDVSSGGEAGVDWANVGSPTTTVNLSGTTVKTATDVETDTADIQSRLPAALVGGRIDANAGAISGDVTAADNLETMLDGTGGQALSLGKLQIVGNDANPLFFVQNNHASGIAARFESTGNGVAFSAYSAASFGANFSGGAGGSVRMGGSGGVDIVLQVEELLGYLALLARKDAGIATDLAALLSMLNNDWGSGAGTFDNTTDSVQALADAGGGGGTDWTTGEKEQIRYRLQLDGTQTAPATDAGDQLPVSLDDVPHGGVAATLTLERMIVESTTLGEPGMKITGNGGGAGIESYGGAGGGAGAFLQGGVDGSGLFATGNGAGDGAQFIAGNTGNGATYQGGMISGNGIQAVALGISGGEQILADITGSLSGTVGGIEGTLGTLDDLWGKIKKFFQLLFRKDAAIATDNATELTEINANGGSGSGAFDNTTDSTQAIADGGGGLDAAGVRAAVGLASANLDTQLGDIPTLAELTTEIGDALTVDVIADSVAADGSRPTIAQALLMITRFLMERSVVSTTVTVKKEDGSTSSMTFTLDDATTPTAITRAS
ncbi:MAG: hypothetical protein H6636_06970 [Anaerolineales bacterium]|nr:hypothetical protein [Anaerolineales bacterium]